MTAQTILLDIASACSATERAHDSGVCFVLSGELDMATAPEVDRLLGLLLEAGHRVAIDCAALTFVDVTASRMLARHLQPGSRATLHSLQPKIERTFRLVGLTHLVAIAL